MAPPSSTPETDSLDLSQALDVLRRRLPLVLLCAVLVAAAAFAFSKGQQKEYTATAALRFGSSNPYLQQVLELSSEGSSGVTGQAGNVQLAEVGDLTGKTARALGVSESEVGGGVDVAGESESNVVTITAKAHSPQLAAAVANTYAKLFVVEQAAFSHRAIRQAIAVAGRQINALPPGQRTSPVGEELENRLQSLRLLAGVHYGSVRVVGRATPPSEPSAPEVGKNTAIGFLIGLLIGFGLAFVLERLQRERRMHDSSDLEDIHRLPLLGAIPLRRAAGRFRRGREEPAATAEAFQMLRARLRFFDSGNSQRIVLVAGGEAGDGVTTVATGLAEAAVRAGSRTLLVELDLQEPALARRLGLEPSPGLAEVLSERQSLESVVQAAELRELQPALPRRLEVLTGGMLRPANAAELLEGPAMENLLGYLRGVYDLVVLDAPPLTARADALPLLRRVDGVLVVARVGHSTRACMEELHRTLEISGAPQLGVVANGVRSRPRLETGAPVGPATPPVEGSAPNPTVTQP